MHPNTGNYQKQGKVVPGFVCHADEEPDVDRATKRLPAETAETVSG